MKNVLALLLFVSLSATLAAQYAEPEPAAKTFAETITSQELSELLTTLASDEFEGRETGKAGQKLAAEYIARYFQELGLPPIMEDTYYQDIAFTSESWNLISLTIGEERLKHLWDYYAYPTTNASQQEQLINELLFLGYGIESDNYSDYKGVDVKGKSILIYSGEPVNGRGISQITGNEQLSEWSDDFRKKLRLAREKGVQTVFIIDTDFKRQATEARRLILNTGLQLGDGEQAEENYANNLFINGNVARQIMGDKYKKVIKARNKMQRKGKSNAVKLPVAIQLSQNKYTRQIKGENVLGYIEGTDDQLKEEVIVITAHYDHLGKKGNAIYNGADDNASGTSTVMEIAEAFVEAKKSGSGPRRSILVMLVSGEEKGLLGSEYYAANPVFPLENTVANINIDMVGRVDQKHKDNPDYIYVIGADRLSTELHEINESVNQQFTQLLLDYTYNDENDPNRYYYRSDHYNFAKNGIPAIFYFNGTHEDYHRVSDTAEKINFEKMEKIGQLAFYTAWELANRDKRIEVDVK
jgi:hypothetical protein